MSGLCDRGDDGDDEQQKAGEVDHRCLDVVSLQRLWFLAIRCLLHLEGWVSAHRIACVIRPSSTRQPLSATGGFYEGHRQDAGFHLLMEGYKPESLTSLFALLVYDNLHGHFPCFIHTSKAEWIFGAHLNFL